MVGDLYREVIRLTERDWVANRRLKEDVEAIRAAARGTDPLPDEVRMLVQNAEAIANAAEDFVGSCEKDRPYAEMFLVGRDDGKLVWRCTHKDPHEFPPSNQ